MMTRGKRPLVILRTKHDRKKVRDISLEPEMIELRRMIREGELDPARAIRQVQDMGRGK
jgi:hypothetical protein